MWIRKLSKRKKKTFCNPIFFASLELTFLFILKLFVCSANHTKLGWIWIYMDGCRWTEHMLAKVFRVAFFLGLNKLN